MNYSDYDIVEFFFPHKGMNRKVAAQRMSIDYAWYLENIRPRPYGSGTVRYGTKMRTGFTTNDIIYDIKGFSYFSPQNGSQILYYLSVFTFDTTAQNFHIIGENQIQFTVPAVIKNTFLPESWFYEETCPVLIEYYTDRMVNLTSDVLQRTVTQLDAVTWQVTLTLNNNLFFDFGNGFGQVNSIYYPDAQVWIEQDGVTHCVEKGFCPNTIPRTCVFQNRLFLCNGFDFVRMWDGQHLTIFTDTFTLQTQNIIRTDDYHVRINLTNANDIDIFQRYVIQVTMNGVNTRLNIINIVQNGTVVDIQVNVVLPQFAGNISITYLKTPPPFSYMHAAYNRFFALGPGKIGIPWKNPGESMRVYYPYSEGRLVNWHDPNTRAMPSIDLSEKHQVPDTLEAITSYGTYTVFFGRNRIQIYTGTTPPIGQNVGNFAWNYNLPVGIAHGNLIKVMANDIWFVSNLDITSIGTLNPAKQMAAEINDDLSVMVKENISQLFHNANAYRATQTVYYEYGGFALFKIGLNPPFCAEVSTRLDRWSLWTGIFANASGFFVDSYNDLGICAKQHVYNYADGKRGVPSYMDYDNEYPVQFAIVFPYVHLPKRFIGKRYKMFFTYPSGFSGDPQNLMKISVSGDLPKSFRIESALSYPDTGDLLGLAPLGNFAFDNPQRPPSGRLKFYSNQFRVSITGQTNCGEISIQKLVLFGGLETPQKGGGTNAL